MIVFFIGFMGSGKSYMASAVAQLLNVPCIDLDAAIEKKEGMRITDLFREKGEAYFRELESALLHDTVTHVENLYKKGPIATSNIKKKHNIFAIISCGGGTPCFHGNMDWMNERGMTIWMAPPVEVLVERLKGEKEKRPLIASMNDEELSRYVSEKLHERKKYYTKAKLTIADPELTPVHLLNPILDAQDFL